MALAYIQEYAELASDSLGNIVPVGKEPAVATQQVTFTSSTASAAFNAKTRFIRITCNAEANLSFGVAPTAAATDLQVQADTPEYFGVVAGQKVAIYDGVT